MVGPLVCFALLAADPPAAAPDPKDMNAYRAAAAKAGRDPEAHVKLALWCEQHGLGAERTKQLALAVLTDPKNALARGLLGLVSYAGDWKKPDQVAEHVRADAELAATLAEYNERRAAAPKSAEGQWDLALWCEAHGLKAEETAHLAAVLRLDPGREGAWRRLGYKKHHGHWMTDDQIAEAAAERTAQEHANRHWRNVLERAREHLASKTRRDDAQRTLAAIRDPRAVPTVWQVFAAKGREADQSLAVQVLGQIDAVAASRSLAMLALQSESAEVRRRAIEALAPRDPRESVGLLVGQVYTPVKYQIRPIAGPGSRGELFVEGQRFNVKRFYNAPRLPSNPANYFDPTTLIQNDRAAQRALMRHAFGMAPANMAMVWDQVTRAEGQGVNVSAGTLTNVFGPGVADELALQRDLARVRQNVNAMRNAMLAEQAQQARDIAMLDEMNALGRRYDEERVLPALRAITGQDLGQDQDAWAKWWTDQQGYAFSPPPKRTFIDQFSVTPALNRLYIHHSCFGAGTMVRTLAGSQAIETLQAGDRVLTRDVASGSLGYEPILAVFHNPPNETLRITLDGSDPIVVTPIHRFWKAGQGWTMARDLKEGDPIRTVDGVRPIAAIARDKVQPVFNLLVAQHHSFFVGKQAALVHDNSLIEPTPHPFDAPPTLAAASEK